MRTLVLGAGATGGYFGGRLAEAGADVTFLVRPERAAGLARTGLVVLSPLGDIRRPVQAVTADRLAPPYDLILLSAKAYDLDTAIAAIRPAVGPLTAVLPLLNGLRHLDRLDEALGAEHVLGGACRIAATLGPEGEIRHLNDVHAVIFGERSDGRTARGAAIAGLLGHARFTSILSDQILQEMWEKFVLLATLAAMTCLMRNPLGPILATAEGEAIILETLEECCRVAAAAGYPHRAETLLDSRALLTRRGSRFAASMLRDIERGGPTEGDHIIGDMLRRAERAAIAAPHLRLARCHLEAYEASREAAKP